MEILKTIEIAAFGIPVGILLSWYIWPRYYFLTQVDLKNGDIFEATSIQELSPKENVWVGYTDYTIRLRKKRYWNKHKLFYENYMFRTKDKLELNKTYVYNDGIKRNIQKI